MALPKIVTILGARPQFIKSAILSRSLKDVLKEYILHTGQHFDYSMSQVFFEQLGIQKPTWHLNCAASSHGAMTAKMLEGIEVVLEEQQPHAVLVYGDTNSTLAGALAASKLHIPIWHIESGVRSFNKRMPEEINRIITDRIADIHFSPSSAACQNLLREGINSSSIYEVGDVMYDLYLESKDKEKQVKLPIEKDFLLVTLHRAENFQSGQEIGFILNGLNEIAEECFLVWPMHPRVEKIFRQKNIILNKNIFVVPPFDYLEMLYVLHRCKGVLTDSGGLQKEAFYASKPCVTIRDETEWVELIASGWNMLVSVKNLYNNHANILEFLKADFLKKKQDVLYGKGDACLKIKTAICGIL